MHGKERTKDQNEGGSILLDVGTFYKGMRKLTRIKTEKWLVEPRKKEKDINEHSVRELKTLHLFIFEHTWIVTTRIV